MSEDLKPCGHYCKFRNNGNCYVDDQMRVFVAFKCINPQINDPKQCDWYKHDFMGF